jgi:acetyl-CoA carboxylase carboxyltransferase component
MTQLVAELTRRKEVARHGGGEKYVERHRSQGKLPVRERIDRLLDSGSPFLELSPLAASDMYDGDAPAPGSSPASAASPDAKSSSSATTPP